MWGIFQTRPAYGPFLTHLTQDGRDRIIVTDRIRPEKGKPKQWKELLTWYCSNLDIKTSDVEKIVDYVEMLMRSQEK